MSMQRVVKNLGTMISFGSHTASAPAFCHSKYGWERYL